VVLTAGLSTAAGLGSGVSGSGRYLDRILNEQPDSPLAQQTRYVLRSMGYLKRASDTDRQ
jgi:hypothetical protein